MTKAGLLARTVPSLAVALLAGAVTAGCAQSDTVVLVHVTASMPVDGIQQLHATVRIGGQTRGIDVPPAPRDITLPTSFTVQLARSLTGDLTVTIDARDAAAAVIASGGQTVSPLQVGEQNELTIDLAPGAVTPDAGMDGPPSTAGTGGVTGGGGTGAGGAGGSPAGSGGSGAGGSGGGGGATGAAGAAGHAGAGGGANGGHGGAAGRAGASGSGGTMGTGGAVGTGGTKGTGGAVGTGGVTATGGSGTGGAATGGTDAGGAAGGDVGGAGGDMGGAAGGSA